MNALFDAEGLRAAHRGQFSLDLLDEKVETPAEQSLDEQPVAVEHSVDGLFSITLGGEPADGGLFGFTIPSPAEAEAVEPLHRNPATCGARGYRRLACCVCWPRPDRCGWGTCTRHALFDVTDTAGDEMPACLRCAQLAVVAGFHVIGRGRA
ncbi:hypothetical protein AB0M48_08125 [Lentzea sp. NPDC051208]|uniref:hypothetical protein n=1 Tax=Lentzea sp. NPDC051208 TaxID=3154642 RepID=UPI00341F7196